MAVKRYAQWAIHFASLDKKTKKAWVTQIIGLIRDQGDRKKDKNLKKLADMLEDKSKVEIIGFCPYYEYTRQDENEGNYLHAIGNPALFVKIKGVPVFMIVGPSLAWGEPDLPVNVDNGTG